MGGHKPLPPPVALKPSIGRLNQTSEEQSPPEREEEEDPANKSILGKVSSASDGTEWRLLQ